MRLTLEDARLLHQFGIAAPSNRELPKTEPPSNWMDRVSNELYDRDSRTVSATDDPGVSTDTADLLVKHNDKLSADCARLVQERDAAVQREQRKHRLLGMVCCLLSAALVIGGICAFLRS